MMISEVSNKMYDLQVLVHFIEFVLRLLEIVPDHVSGKSRLINSIEFKQLTKDFYRYQRSFSVVLGVSQ